MPTRADEFAPAFSAAFDEPGPVNEFTTAFSGAFDPTVTGAPITFTITGVGLAAVGNVLDSPGPAYLLHVVEPGGTSLAINTITASSRTHLECTWTFHRPGTHYFVVADADGIEVSARLPVIVTA